jgi:GT2 family glycosyltransferase
MKEASISIVIPTFNGQQLLAKNLPAVLKSARRNDQISIIDDASTDDSVEWLCKKFDLTEAESKKDYTIRRASKSKADQPQVTLIVNHQNLRFGASCNRAIDLATTKLVFLINNDVVPQQNTISKLVRHFEDTNIFAVGCHEIEENKGGKSGGKNQLWFERGMFIHSRAKDFSTGETAWASGGSAMFDREKWQQLGGFDARYYPAYWEDVDLSFRARSKGWHVLFDSEAVVYHNHETTHNDVFGQEKMRAISWRNARTFAWTNSTLWQKFQVLFWTPYWLLKAG